MTWIWRVPFSGPVLVIRRYAIQMLLTVGSAGVPSGFSHSFSPVRVKVSFLCVLTIYQERPASLYTPVVYPGTGSSVTV